MIYAGADPNDGALKPQNTGFVMFTRFYVCIRSFSACLSTKTHVELQCGQAEVNCLAAVPLSGGGRSTQIFCPFFVNKSGIARLRRAVLRTAENPLALSPWRPVRLKKVRFSETAATRPSEVVEKC